MGICHGGMIATFCDMLLPISAHYLSAELERRFLPTINLQVDYLAASKLGAWVQGEAQLLRATRSMVFMQGVVSADGERGGPRQRHLQDRPALRGCGDEAATRLIPETTMSLLLTRQDAHPFMGMDVPWLLEQRALTRRDHPFIVWVPFDGPASSIQLRRVPSRACSASPAACTRAACAAASAC